MHYVHMIDNINNTKKERKKTPNIVRSRYRLGGGNNLPWPKRFVLSEWFVELSIIEKTAGKRINIQVINMITCSTKSKKCLDQCSHG